MKPKEARFERPEDEVALLALVGGIILTGMLRRDQVYVGQQGADICVRAGSMAVTMIELARKRVASDLEVEGEAS